ncbi:TVP38/TMEM64 family protein [Kineosporia sp. J2-2]|uniref:TVP38/TMEM64 family membrane protein n=1 Tax=Kineosporia corallincola TaxID=2835133 RepID=A0ABS5TQ61_9ACTN|nr:TVP38/TMEM64 family protein [Kineosporia corallincola]MBT0773226.1 TVP38/TMEM64 family protein [Kineosporia corallincola]
MRRPVLRLAGLLTLLCVAGLLTAAFLPVSPDGLEGLVQRFGLLAAPVFVVVSALLALVFVPGPLLSAASGAMFGTGLGFACSVVSSTLTSVLALLIARRTGGSAVRELSGERALALIDLARRHGTVAVVVQRLIPGVPDAPLSYAFGLLGVRAGQIALGTLVGSAPRAFAYTALGDAAVSGDRTLAVVATVVGVAVSVLGLVLGWLLTRRRRSTGDDGRPPSDVAPGGRSHAPDAVSRNAGEDQ